ncbi:MAG: succinate dehydrogenase, cytochrome b556 subunit [Pseudoxanthomonas sp.]
MAEHPRPQSPHLQIYAWQLTSVLSILHRATGGVLAIGAFVLTAWLVAAAGSADAFEAFNALAGSLPGVVVLLAVAASLAYHLLNGIRHLLWDIGWGFELPRTYFTGWTVVALSIVLTALLAWAGLRAGGIA